MPFPLTQTREHRGRAAPARTASITGLGHYLPDEVVPNDSIAERIGVDDEWIVRRTGIRSRRRAAPDERVEVQARQPLLPRSRAAHKNREPGRDHPQKQPARRLHSVLAHGGPPIEVRRVG
jgi:hypothetical protein